MDIVKGKIGNALTSAASNHVVATANDIYDESIGKYQNVLNNDLQGIIENNPLINGLQLALKPSDPNYLGIEYIYYVDRGNSGIGAIELPLATSNNAGLISPELYNKLEELLNQPLLIGDLSCEPNPNKVIIHCNQRNGHTTTNIPLVNPYTAGLISPQLYNKVTGFLNASPIVDDFDIVVTEDDINDVKFHYRYLDTDGTYKTKDINFPFATGSHSGLMTKGMVNKYAQLTSALYIYGDDITFSNSATGLDMNFIMGLKGLDGKVTIPLASNTSNGVLSKEDYVALHNLIDNSSSTNSFIEYNQGHNTCDDFADIPANKHICLVDLTGIAAEGETSKALTVVMEGTGEYDGAEVLLYCHHDGAADLGIGVPASSTNGAEYVLITNNGEQYIYAGIQELDFVLSCTYINNKWYVRKV